MQAKRLEPNFSDKPKLKYNELAFNEFMKLKLLTWELLLKTCELVKLKIKRL